MDMDADYGILVAMVETLMNMTLPLYKFCPTTARALRMAALTPFLAAGGIWVDSFALRGNFRPVIASYHAICAQNRRNWRCARLAEIEMTLAENTKAPGDPRLSLKTTN